MAFIQKSVNSNNLHFRQIIGTILRNINTSANCDSSWNPKHDLTPLPAREIRSVLLIEKLTRFEVELHKGIDSEEIKRVFPGAYQTYKRHKYNFELLSYYLREKYLIKVTTLKARASASLLQSDFIPKAYDAILSAGGDGTYLQAASLVPPLNVAQKPTPLYGFNTDPVRSEGRLCLKYNHVSLNDPHTNLLEKLPNLDIHPPKSSTTRYPSSDTYIKSILDGLLKAKIYPPLFRQRISAKLVSNDSNDIYSLDSQINYPQHESIHLYKAVNDVLIAENDCSKALYIEVTVDNESRQRIKCSGFLISSGTGSSAWAYNIGKVDKEMVTSLFQVLKSEDLTLSAQLTEDKMQTVIQCVNQRLLFDPSSSYLRYVVREPIENRVFQVQKSNSFAKRILIKPLSSNIYIYCDGQANFHFPPGKMLSLETYPSDGFWTAR